MPDFSVADTQAPAASGGGPNWLLIGGAVAAGLGLLVFLKGKSGGAGAAPVQTQESLAVGDLAYQVQNGLGALGIQNDRNQAATNSAIAAWGQDNERVAQIYDAASAVRFDQINSAIAAWGQDNERVGQIYDTVSYQRLQGIEQSLAQLFSQLQFRPPVMSSGTTVDRPIPLRGYGA